MSVLLSPGSFRRHADSSVPQDMWTTHHSLYEGYVTRYNELVAADDAARASTSPVEGLAAVDRMAVKRELSRMRTAVRMHELYFSNISQPGSAVKSSSLAYQRFSSSFGDFVAWQRDVVTTAQTSPPGWVVTALDVYTGVYVVTHVPGHDGCSPALYPVVVIDTWEHAWRPRWRDVATYCADMLAELNWDVIERRVNAAETMRRASRDVLVSGGAM